MNESWTILKLLKWTTNYFNVKGIESPRLSAELLLSATLKIDRVDLYVNFERPMNAEELASYREKVSRRARREPVQYILTETEFWSLPLHVNPAVLIPRAETETLVEEALKRLPSSARVLDVGTGSGAIAIALAHENPDIVVTALDCSEHALEVARGNAKNHGVDDRITFFLGDMKKLPCGPFDMIVSNPPYILSGDWEELMPEVREYEPRLALDGGEDGLAAFRCLTAQATQVTVPGSWLMVEVGYHQADAVSQLFTSAGLTDIDKRNDYAGIPRVVSGKTQP